MKKSSKITINELRLGNFVYGNSLHPNEEVAVKLIHENGFYYDALNVHKQQYETGCHKDAIKPIKLTKERILKFGFQKSEKEKNVWWISLNNFIIRLYKENGFFCYYVNRMQTVRIKYVHEIQNICFTLTKTELK